MINSMMITGTVRNTGTEKATYNRVYATVYDGPSGTGNVVGVTSCTSQPYNVDPGQTATFEMGFFRTAGKSYTSMRIVAESDQYAATTEYTAAISQTSTTTPSPTSVNPSPTITEFPSFIAISLLIAAMLIVVAAVKRKQL
jgi:hypothetical protein